MRARAARGVRAPLLHFLVLGGALLALQSALGGARPEPLRVARATLDRIAAEAARELGRAPAPEELAARVDAWIDEELLVRAARARGWHETDPVVQLRLLRNLRFVSPDESASDAELLARAYALGLDRGDLVVRRRLAERMRMTLIATATQEEPDDAALAARLAAEPERYRRPALVQLTHVFLSADRRGASLEADARRLAEALRAAAAPPERAVERGDPSLLPAKLPLSTQRALESRLGPHFALRALACEPERWCGPLPSAFGAHLVWVHRRIEARDPGVAEVRHELLADWRAERERAVLTRELARLRDAAQIEWDEPV